MASEIVKFCSFCYGPIPVLSDGEWVPPDLNYIRLLSRHLKIVKKEDKNEEDEDDSLVVCDTCTHLGNCFQELFLDFEEIRLRLDWVVQRIHGRMTMRRMEEGERDERMKRSVQKWRKEVITKCQLKLKKSSESGLKVLLKRVDEDDDEEEDGLRRKKLKYLPIKIKREVEIKSEPEEVFTVELMMGTLSFLAVLALSLPQEPPERQCWESDLRIVTVSSVVPVQEEEVHPYENGQLEETADYDDYVQESPSPSYQLPYHNGEQMEVVENGRKEEDDEDDIQIIEPDLYPLQSVPIQPESNSYPRGSNNFVNESRSGPSPAILVAALHHFNQQNQIQTPPPSNDIHLRDYLHLRNILTPPNTDASSATNTSSSNSPTQIFSTTYHPPQAHINQQPQIQPERSSSHSNLIRLLEAPVSPDPPPTQPTRHIHTTTHYPHTLPPQAPQPTPTTLKRTTAPPRLLPIRPPPTTSTTSNNIHHCFICKTDFPSEEEVALHRVVQHNLMYFLNCHGCHSIFGTDRGLKNHQKSCKSSKCQTNININSTSSPPPRLSNNHQLPEAASVTPPPPPPPNLTQRRRPPNIPVNITSVQTPAPRISDSYISSPTEWEICFKTFPTEVKLEIHRGVAHNLVRVVKCNACGSRFASHSSLRSHQEKNRLTKCNPNPDPQPQPSPPPQVHDKEVVEVVQLPPQISWRILSEKEPRRAPLVSASTPMPPEAVLLPPIQMPTPPPPPPPPLIVRAPVPISWEKAIIQAPTSGTVPLALPKCAMCNDYFRSAAQLIVHLRVVHKVNKPQREDSSNVQVINLD